MHSHKVGDGIKMSEIREECGVFGMYKPDRTKNDTHCATSTYLGLMALQHRGQEACGIAVNRERAIYFHKDVGLVNEVFDDEAISKLTGSISVGHVRYSTRGTGGKENAQPLVLNYAKGQLAIVHNGNITNYAKLKREYELNGAIYQTTTDTEIIAHAIARHRLSAGSVERALLEAMKILEGAYSLIVMSPDKLIAARDPHGFRPLCYGKREDGCHVFASETCALDVAGAKFIRDIEPGEIVTIKDDTLTSITELCGTKPEKLCIFEHIYFARPDSFVGGQFVNEARRITGRLLAKRAPVEADIVIGVPDSGIPSAIGYAEESKIPYQEGFGKNRYAGRTFIRPDQLSREAAVRLKLNPLRQYIEGKRVVLVDDSIVRGTTMKLIIRMLRISGAKEVHIRISSPPFLHPCYYGTDVPNKSQLISAEHSTDEVCAHIGADSLAFLELSDLSKIAPHVKGFCDACFTGKYAVRPQE